MKTGFLRPFVFTLVLAIWSSLAVFSAAGQNVDQLLAAAKKDDVKSAAQLGYIYMNGQGVPQDAKEAVKWLKKAAKSDPQAQLSLGCAYALGEGAGTKPDPREALNWFRKAADQGLVEAQFRVAACYEKGLGAPKNDAESAKWYRKAADQGLAEAQEALGNMFYQGRGVTQDYAEATKWYVKAAEQGSFEAQYRMGVCYSLGQGVPRDAVEAYKWLTLASSGGRKDIVQYREKLPSYSRMTPEQLAEGEKRAKDFAVRR